jgi:fluoride exporter
MSKFIYLIIGGIIGTMARYLLAGFVYEILGTSFPYGTLIVNLSGCLIIGILSTLADSKFLLTPNLRVLLMIGFCGAYTTFSTFIFETSNLIKDGETIRALMNVLLSVIVGFVVFRIGMFLGEIL